MPDEQQQATNGLAREDATAAFEAGFVFMRALQPLVEKYEISEEAMQRISTATVTLVAQILGYCAIADEASARIKAENAAIEATFESIFSEFKL